MEHKLIRGGGEYLPFARSRIKQLRSTGQAYASDKFVVNGVTIKVWIEPDQDYIDINGGGVDLLMDSGVVALNSGDLFGDGALYECDGVQEYNRQFSTVHPKYWTNPDHSKGGESSQLSGKLSFSERFSGAVTTNRVANSFTANQIPDPDKPGESKRNPADFDLWGKSFTARSVPASIFTGRTRMYVQAMYGLWLHPTRKATSYIPTPVSGNYAAPYLQLTNYKGGGDKTVYPQPLDLTTSSGVFFDSVQGKHWLIEAHNNNSHITLYPLVATKEREALRKFLRNGYTKKVLSATAKDHLEAYILSTALPDRANAHVVYTWNPMEGTPVSLGYGWHFNWSGTEATLVRVGQAPQGGGYAVMFSNVFTLNLSCTHDPDSVQALTATPSFTATLGVVGPTLWYSVRGLWEITGAAFDTMGQDKILPQLATAFAHGPVPFYAFYKKDELQLCTIEVSSVDATVNVFTGSTYSSGTDRAHNPTLGGGESWGQSISTNQHWLGTVRVGSAAYGPTCTNHGAGGVKFELTDKNGSIPDVITFGGGGGPLGGTWVLPIGSPISLSPMTWEMVTYGPGYNHGGPVTWNYSYSEVSTSFSIQNRGGMVCMTPPNDAEALAVWVDWTIIDTRTGTRRKFKDEYGWKWTNAVHAFPGWDDTGGIRITYDNWDSPTLGTLVDTIPINTVTTTSTTTNKLIAGKTASDAALSIAPFFADFTQDRVDNGGGACISNTSDSPVVDSPLLGVKVGMDGIASDDLAIVGWA